MIDVEQAGRNSKPPNWGLPKNDVRYSYDKQVIPHERPDLPVMMVILFNNSTWHAMTAPLRTSLDNPEEVKSKTLLRNLSNRRKNLVSRLQASQRRIAQNRSMLGFSIVGGIFADDDSDDEPSTGDYMTDVQPRSKPRETSFDRDEDIYEADVDIFSDEFRNRLHPSSQAANSGLGTSSSGDCDAPGVHTKRKEKKSRRKFKIGLFSRRKKSWRRQYNTTEEILVVPSH